MEWRRERGGLETLDLIQARPFFKDYFLMWTIFKVFIECVAILLVLCFGFFGLEAYGILAP